MPPFELLAHGHLNPLVVLLSQYASDEVDGIEAARPYPVVAARPALHLPQRELDDLVAHLHRVVGTQVDI